MMGYGITNVVTHASAAELVISTLAKKASLFMGERFAAGIIL